MSRATSAVARKKRHKSILEQAEGYYGNKSRSFRAANEQLLHSYQYAYRDRRQRKRDFRSLWITRINARLRERGISYSRFIGELNKQNVYIDRKILGELATNQPEKIFDLLDTLGL